MSDQPPLISITEAAKMLGISPTTARELAAKGRLPGVLPEKIGNQWRVNRAALMEYIESYRRRMGERARHGD